MLQGSNKYMFDLVILIAVIVVAVVFYTGDRGEDNALEASLNVMGDKLFAMVPDAAAKMRITDLYNDFRKRAVAGDVAPEKIETVAADILNASNIETELTPEEAEYLLNPVLASAVLPVPEAHTEKPAKRYKTIKAPPKPEELDGVGERIEIMFNFNEQMLRARRAHAKQKKRLIGQLHYQANNGLNIVVDAKLKAQIDSVEHDGLRNELERLERKELVNWQENMYENLSTFIEDSENEKTSVHIILKELQAHPIFAHVMSPDSVSIVTHIEALVEQLSDSAITLDINP